MEIGHGRFFLVVDMASSAQRAATAACQKHRQIAMIVAIAVTTSGRVARDKRPLVPMVWRLRWQAIVCLQRVQLLLGVSACSKRRREFATNVIIGSSAGGWLYKINCRGVCWKSQDWKSELQKTGGVREFFTRRCSNNNRPICPASA